MAYSPPVKNNKQRGDPRRNPSEPPQIREIK